MSQFDKDLQASIAWLVDVAMTGIRYSLATQRDADWAMDKVATVTACAELPGDMPLRVRCFPNCLNLKA